MTSDVDKFSSYRVRLIVATVPLLLLLFILIGSHWGKACAITADGKVLAYARSKQAAENAVRALLTDKSEEIGQEVFLATELTYKTRKCPVSPLDSRQLNEELNTKLDFATKGVALKIDGKPELYFKNRDLAEKFLQQIKDKFRTGEDCQVHFAQKVELVDQTVNINQLHDLNEALHLAIEGKGIPRVHTVKQNETLWELALENNTTVEHLKKLNPGLTENLQIGQKIKVSGSAPLLTVVTRYEKTNRETLPYEVEHRNDSSLPLGKSEVVQEGREGLKEVVYRFLAYNGKVTEKEIVTEKVIKEPLPRIIKRGTKFILSSRGGGLIWPTPGRLSSPFGTRWGRKHTGIDIAANYGGPVRAAAPGRVTKAGWDGGYGRTVEIYHGNGAKTRYAHLSSITVKVGQTVNQGQLIGRVGSTGASTGPHLHFEVLVNGVPRDPLRYL